MDLVSQIADSTMTRLPRHEIRAANALNRSLVALFPRSLKIKSPPRRFGYPDRMELTWTCSAPSAFTVVVKPGRQSLNNELKVPVDDQEEAQWDASVNHSGDAVSDISYIITTDKMALLSDYHPGRVYTIQVYANRTHFSVAYSQPFLFECPLNCVNELKGEMRGGTLFVSFSTVRGACQYEIITIFPDEVRNTDLTDGTEWSKEILGKAPIRVKVSAISAEGVRSYTPMTVDVIPEPSAVASAPPQLSGSPSKVAASSDNKDPPKGQSTSQKPRIQKSKAKRRRKGKNSSGGPIPEPDSDSEESEDDVEYEFVQGESETDDDASDDGWTEHVVGRSKRTPKVETTLNHDWTTICGIEVHVNDILEVELGSSKSQHRFVHFLIYVEMISEVQKTNRTPNSP
ncbi:uncharacterized protein EV420DRAFT_1133591 [Desarmillaria tabescens]|uniref:Uncharacterized protein n=1 Tax=Armillaria tabescens TaxID=1929756 RepID=A0AA39JCT5_ARMTA|nr:uncharacterized protein EV420DRAFT_1133591 [Desarmillaria tabescens]KAK0440406.1 hypothetical protein EV420DRAFT_1133591 [Desarmillaria tabescens]